MYFKKKLNQNFLINKNLIKLIPKFLPLIIKNIFIEIGLGNGELSFNIILNNNYYNVLFILIEKDRFLFKKFIKYYKFINLINLDILNFNFFFLKKFFFFKFKINLVGNIPYNISIFLLLFFLNYVNNINNQIFMIQRKLYNKLILNLNKNFKNITLLLNCFYKIKEIFKINKNYFYPQPKIKSSFTSFKPLYFFLINFNDIENFKNFLKFIFNLKKKNFFLNKYKIILNNFYDFIKIFFFIKNKFFFFFNSVN